MIGEVIERLRQERGLSRAQLAEKCGMTRSGILKIENGHRTPTEETVLSIAYALGCTPTDLYQSVVISKTEYEALLLIADVMKEYLGTLKEGQ